MALRCARRAAAHLLASSLIDAIRLQSLAYASVEAKRDAEATRIKKEHEEILSKIAEKWDRADDPGRIRRRCEPLKSDDQPQAI